MAVEALVAQLLIINRTSCFVFLAVEFLAIPCDVLSCSCLAIVYRESWLSWLLPCSPCCFLLDFGKMGMSFKSQMLLAKLNDDR